MRRCTAIALFALGLACTCVHAANTDRSVIRVGSEVSFAPYAFQDKGGNPVGYSIDLLEAVARAEGLELQISAAPWDVVWSELLAGKIDVLPIVARLPEREGDVEFSEPHTDAPDAFFVRTGERKLASIDDARGKTIVVMRADAAHHALLGRHFAGRIVLTDTIPQGLFLVASGKYDAFLGSIPVCMAALRNGDGITGLEPGPPVPDYSRVFHFAVKKGNTELRDRLNRGLRAVKSNGEYERIYRRWLTGSAPWWMSSQIRWVIAVFVLLIAGAAVVWLNRRRHRTARAA